MLVHVGHQLRLLGPDLAVVRSVSLAGPLAWVSAAPSGDHFAVGVYEERHTPEVHRQLVEATGDEPEEDVEVSVYDGDLKLLLTTERSGAAWAPVLSDAGEIRVRSAKVGRWVISEYRWDRTERVIARTQSGCRPRLAAAMGGGFFLTGCDASGARWYRMLRADGHPVLKGSSTTEEVEQAFSGTTAGEFAVRVVKAARSMGPGQPFRRSDLEGEQVGVYRASDGRRLGLLSAKEVPMVEESFTLSPDGREMALIGAKAIHFYAVGQP